jgi:hypothetical protein
MGLYDAVKASRRHAKLYLEMMRYVRDEWQMKILSELSEACEAKAKLFEERAKLN